MQKGSSLGPGPPVAHPINNSNIPASGMLSAQKGVTVPRGVSGS